MATRKQHKRKMKLAIQAVIAEMMERVMSKVLETDPFIKEAHRSKKPLYAALVPDEIFKGSHFERRFVTPFGNAWEQLAVVAATNGLGRGVRSHKIDGLVKGGRLRRINEVINSLEHSSSKSKKRKPDWDAELEYILNAKIGRDIPTSVVCDLFAQNTADKKRFAFEIKAPMPNSDQTKVSKEKLFKLYSMDPPQVDEAYYVLPYNPYGTRESYAWSYPMRWFNMKDDRVVLIGDEFWEKIGGAGTYQAFIDAVNDIGPEFKERIYREYLGMEPPSNFDDTRL